MRSNVLKGEDDGKFSSRREHVKQHIRFIHAYDKRACSGFASDSLC